MSAFKVGDKVRVVDANMRYGGRFPYPHGHVGTVTGVYHASLAIDYGDTWDIDRFERVVDTPADAPTITAVQAAYTAATTDRERTMLSTLWPAAIAALPKPKVPKMCKRSDLKGGMIVRTSLVMFPVETFQLSNGKVYWRFIDSGPAGPLYFVDSVQPDVYVCDATGKVIYE